MKNQTSNGEVKNQVLTDQYAIYESDCMYVLPTLKPNSVHFTAYSPPFLGLFNYSSSPNDFSNCETRDQGLTQYELLVKEVYRVMKPGRICAVHCTDLMNADGSQYDYPAEITRIHERNGFKRMNKITVPKEPMKVRMRTMVKSLMHVMLIEDATNVFTAMPDYVLIFRKDGENEVPVTHEGGLKEYFGELPLLPFQLKGIDDENDFLTLSRNVFSQLQKKYWNFEGDHKENKLSHMIFRRYMNSVWDDVRIDNVLPFRDGRDEDDEKHVHPLQLDVIDRLVTLYTNPGEICLTPFMGVGTEVFSPVSLGRKGIGIELKPSYFKQAIANMKEVYNRFSGDKQMELFEVGGSEDWISM